MSKFTFHIFMLNYTDWLNFCITFKGYIMYVIVYLLVTLFVTGDHCSCFSDDRFQPDTATFKSDGSDVYAYILSTWWSGVATTKTRFKLRLIHIWNLYVGTKL